MELRVAAVTVRVAPLDTMLPEVAVMVVEPAATGVATPLVPPELLMVATLRKEDAQVTNLVMSRVEPSVYVPVAVNCWFVPRAMVALVGVTAMETRVA